MRGHRSTGRQRLIEWTLAALAVTLVGTGCGGSTNVASTTQTHSSPTSGANASASAAPNTSSGSGQLDPEVSMPANFPSDFPIYPGARPTQQATLASNGNPTFEVTLETLDSVDKVQAFYTAQLKQGDWTISFEASSTGTYGATFTRKSNSKYSGLLSVDGTKKQGVTVIGVVLGSS